MNDTTPNNDVLTSIPKQAPQDDGSFCLDLIRKYPKANKKVKINVAQYSLKLLKNTEDPQAESTTRFVSPHGMEFQTTKDFCEGALLKIEVNVPEYWIRKKSLVSYSRIDSPGSFSLLAKVISTEEIGKRNKKRNVIVQTVNIDEVDEVVLKNFLDEG